MNRTLTTWILAAAAAASAWAQAEWMGRWEGALELEGGDRLHISVMLVPSGALLDIPGEQLFGYPSAQSSIDADRIYLAFVFGGGRFVLEGALEPDGIRGSYSQGSAGGAMFLIKSAIQPDPAATVTVCGFDGAELVGTLLVPPGDAPRPLVILHAGLGASDRNGNNYNMRGRHDALGQLASALLSRDVASLRYDKRGSGASTWLVPTERSLSFEAWVADLRAIADAMAADPRFSTVWILGLNDGALVAVAAANRGGAERGVMVACASSLSPRDAYAKAVADAPEALRAEGEAIMAALDSGGLVPSLSAYYVDAFRPSYQPYLVEAFRFDLKRELAAYGGDLLLVQGDMDMQATLADFITLGEAAPSARTIIVPRMNHVLKDVQPQVDDNFAAFSDPSYQVSTALADAIADWVSRP